MKVVCLLTGSDYRPGDPAPTGYLAWNEWAEVQYKSGLRQQQCGRCSKWFFPQELSNTVDKSTARRGKHGPLVVITERVCLKCDPQEPPS
jgi:hypothetical protein